MSLDTVFTAASLGCALALTPTLLIAARTAQGAGAALLVPNSLALLHHAYPEARERGRAVGWWLAGASVALTAGPPIGLAFVPMMGAVLPLTWLHHGWQSDPAVRPPLPQGGLISAVACLALLGVERGTSYWAMCAQLVAMGCGIALSVPPLTSALLGSVDRSRSGVAAGVLNSAKYIIAW